MTVPVKVLIMLLVWFLYMLLGYKGCIEPCCDASSAIDEPIEKPVEAAKRFPIDFSWNSATAFTNDGFADYKNQLLAGMTEDNILEIVGLYSAGETAPEGYENMGLARADQIRKLLLSDIPEDRIRLRARLVDGQETGNGKYFESAAFAWEDATETVVKQVEEIDDRIIIRFPSNSVEKEASSEVDTYLNKLATRMQESGQRIKLTGHTDSDGDDSYNMRLSRKRAEKIKNILISKGVNANQIDVKYRGSEVPVASNNTENGKRENRRVEVVLL